MKNFRPCHMAALLLAVLSATMVMGETAPETTVTIHAGRPGATINKNVYGQFSEHLESGIYGGIYVGENSPIPNTRGFRNDVIAALKELKVPMVRWPGGFPHKKMGLYVDEWGTWYKPEPGSNPGFLVQQNTLRDAVVAAANLNIFHKYADRVRTCIPKPI